MKSHGFVLGVETVKNVPVFLSKSSAVLVRSRRSGHCSGMERMALFGEGRQPAHGFRPIVARWRGLEK